MGLTPFLQQMTYKQLRERMNDKYPYEHTDYGVADYCVDGHDCSPPAPYDWKHEYIAMQFYCDDPNLYLDTMLEMAGKKPVSDSIVQHYEKDGNCVYSVPGEFYAQCCKL